MTSAIHLLAQAATQSSEPWVGQSLLGGLRLDTLTQTGWGGWLLLLLGILGGLIAGRAVQHFLRSLADRLTAHGWPLRGTAVKSLAAPASLALVTLGLSLGLSGVKMSAELNGLVLKVLSFLYLLCAAWAAYNLVDLVDVALRAITAKTESKLDDQIVPLIRKALRIFVIVVFFLFVAENIFGADIGAWLAGLGIAGLAVSLASQDSIKNVFGSITILLDRPFAMGDVITYGGHTGTVEEIGFRSTRIRTLEGGVVTVPNSKFVDSDVLNITRRQRIRRVLDVTIPYDTPPEKVDQAVQIIKDILAAPEIASAFDLEKFPPRVVFDEFNAASLNIKVMYWHHPPDFWMFMNHRQEFNRRLLRAFADAGIEFAFPTQTVYLAGDVKRELAVKIERTSETIQ